MRRAENATPAQWGRPADTSPALSTVVYRSRAVAEMTPPALHDLTRAAQARNAREALTGLMLYDNGRFFQWLEGPAAGVDRVMGSIHRDRRHTDIEVLNSQPVRARMFAGWSMKLAAEGAASVCGRQDVIEPPREVVQALRTRPQAAPVLLTKLGPAAEGAPRAEGDEVKLNAKTASILKSVILSVVLPAVLGTGAAVAAPDRAAASARAGDLAELLIATDQAAAVELIREMHASVGSAARLYTTLLEPAARTLGDLWNEDDCSDVDLTLGLCRLQTAIRLLSADHLRAVPGALAQPAVLIVPEPGELHRLGAALDNSILGNAGWSPDCAYPADDRALQEILASKWFDVLDLSLSIALRREHFLPRLTETIARARGASQNPALVVVVGGRVFREQRAAGTRVGADLAVLTSGTVDRSILRQMSATRSRTEEHQVVATAC